MLIDIHFSGSLFPIFGTKMYIALISVVLNLIVAVGVSALVAALGLGGVRRREIVG
jgi:hypothetical protein